jgi:hypothetical protein
VKITKVKEGYGVMIRTVSAEGKAHNGFQWPLEPQDPGEFVTAPDWNPSPTCGGGLHGCLWGQNPQHIIGAEDTTRKWQACLVKLDEVVKVDGKIKAPRCRVIAVGDRSTICNYVASLAPRNVGVPYSSTSAGNNGQASAGDYGQASAGYNGQASAGYNGQASAGDYGQASAGYNGQASAGDYGQASAGYYGQASAGNNGQASAGYNGQASAGEKGTLVVRYYDPKANRYRVAVGYVGEDGILPNTVYVVDGDGKLVPKAGATHRPPTPPSEVAKKAHTLRANRSAT